MKRPLPLTAFLFILPSLFFSVTKAQKTVPDTASVGIYVTSIYDIDFKQKEYAVDYWLWLKYKNKDLDFVNNLEIPMAKNVSRSFFTIDTSGGRVYLLMKMQCIMKDSWKIDNFPFDRQTLRLSFESAKYDAKAMVFVADTLGEDYDKRTHLLLGWNIDSFAIHISNKVYETAFGDETLLKPRAEYSAFQVKIGLKRDATGLFWKMFLGMYVAFLIAYVCFYIHADGIDSRFGLSVGSLFAVIGNKYIIDSSLPESTSFTLVDILHQVTLVFILLTITSTAYSLKLVKQHKIRQARKFDMVAAQVFLALYLIINFYFIWRAKTG